jgi:uncharacterized membrane protein HdeD (DUF308 family)
MLDTVESLAQHWWALALRGVLGIMVGLIALFFPGVTLTALVLLLAAYLLVDGVFAIAAAFRPLASMSGPGRCSWKVSPTSSPA